MVEVIKGLAATEVSFKGTRVVLHRWGHRIDLLRMVQRRQQGSSSDNNRYCDSGDI